MATQLEYYQQEQASAKDDIAYYSERLQDPKISTQLYRNYGMRKIQAEQKYQRMTEAIASYNRESSLSVSIPAPPNVVPTPPPPLPGSPTSANTPTDISAVAGFTSSIGTQLQQASETVNRQRTDIDVEQDRLYWHNIEVEKNEGKRYQAAVDTLKSYDRNIQNGQFVGSETEYQAYQRAYQDYESARLKYETAGRGLKEHSQRLSSGIEQFNLNLGNIQGWQNLYGVSARQQADLQSRIYNEFNRAPVMGTLGILQSRYNLTPSIRAELEPIASANVAAQAQHERDQAVLDQIGTANITMTDYFALDSQGVLAGISPELDTSIRGVARANTYAQYRGQQQQAVIDSFSANPTLETYFANFNAFQTVGLSPDTISSMARIARQYTTDQEAITAFNLTPTTTGYLALASQGVLAGISPELDTQIRGVAKENAYAQAVIDIFNLNPAGFDYRLLANVSPDVRTGIFNAAATNTLLNMPANIIPQNASILAGLGILSASQAKDITVQAIDYQRARDEYDRQEDIARADLTRATALSFFAGAIPKAQVENILSMPTGIGAFTLNTLITGYNKRQENQANRELDTGATQLFFAGAVTKQQALDIMNAPLNTGFTLYNDAVNRFNLNLDFLQGKPLSLTGDTELKAGDWIYRFSGVSPTGRIGKTEVFYDVNKNLLPDADELVSVSSNWQNMGALWTMNPNTNPYLRGGAMLQPWGANQAGQANIRLIGAQDLLTGTAAQQKLIDVANWQRWRENDQDLRRAMYNFNADPSVWASDATRRVAFEGISSEYIPLIYSPESNLSPTVTKADLRASFFPAAMPVITGIPQISILNDIQRWSENDGSGFGYSQVGFASPVVNNRGTSSDSDWFYSLNPLERLFAGVTANILNPETAIAGISNMLGRRDPEDTFQLLPFNLATGSFPIGFESATIRNDSGDTETIRAVAPPRITPQDTYITSIRTTLETQLGINKPLSATDKILKGITAGATSYLPMTAVSLAGFGAGLGVISRASPTLARSIGLGALGYGVADIGGKVATGRYGQAALETGLFVGLAPVASAGYYVGANARLPLPVSRLVTSQFKTFAEPFKGVTTPLSSVASRIGTTVSNFGTNLKTSIATSDYNPFNYGISYGAPKGFMLKAGGQYVVPEAPMWPGRSLVPVETLPSFNRPAFFATPPRGGLTDLYVTVPKSEIPALLEKYQFELTTAKTPYGSMQIGIIRGNAPATNPLQLSPANFKPYTRAEAIEILNRPLYDMPLSSMRQFNTAINLIRPTLNRMGLDPNAAVEISGYDPLLFGTGNLGYYRPAWSGRSDVLRVQPGISTGQGITVFAHEAAHKSTVLGSGIFGKYYHPILTRPLDTFAAELSAFSYQTSFMKTFGKTYGFGIKTSPEFGIGSVLGATRSFVRSPSTENFGTILNEFAYESARFIGGTGIFRPSIKPEYRFATASSLKSDIIGGLQSFRNKIPIRVERKLDISPASLKSQDISARPSLNAINYDFDVKTGFERGGGVEYNIFGGFVKGRPLYPEEPLIPGLGLGGRKLLTWPGANDLNMLPGARMPSVSVSPRGGVSQPTITLIPPELSGFGGNRQTGGAGTVTVQKTKPVTQTAQQPIIDLSGLNIPSQAQPLAGPSRQTPKPVNIPPKLGEIIQNIGVKIIEKPSSKARTETPTRIIDLPEFREGINIGTSLQTIMKPKLEPVTKPTKRTVITIDRPTRTRIIPDIPTWQDIKVNIPGMIKPVERKEKKPITAPNIDISIPSLKPVLGITSTTKTGNRIDIKADIRADIRAMVGVMPGQAAKVQPVQIPSLSPKQQPRQKPRQQPRTAPAPYPIIVPKMDTLLNTKTTVRTGFKIKIPPPPRIPVFFGFDKSKQVKTTRKSKQSAKEYVVKNPLPGLREMTAGISDVLGSLTGYNQKPEKKKSKKKR